MDMSNSDGPTVNFRKASQALYKAIFKKWPMIGPYTD